MLGIPWPACIDVFLNEGRRLMQIVYERCAGLDVHKKSVMACLITPAPSGERRKERQTFSTMTADLVRLREWLIEQQCSQVAMESTGVFWRPIFNILEGHLEVMVVNAQHIKAVPGRKTDIKDAEWIADLLQHGLLRPSFIPPAWQRIVRELTRSRASLSEERSRVIARLQKGLEDANIKLASVASDLMGKSAQQMLHALLEGELTPEAMAQFARGRMRPKREQLVQALTGHLQAHHRFLLAQHLKHLSELQEAIARLSTEIAERLRPYEELLVRLETIPGVKRRLAEVILAEIGTDMRRFPSAQHLASWAGMCPGNHESGGKRLSGKTRKGSQWLRTALVEAAHAASHCKNAYLSAQYHRLAFRRGKKRAAVALAHTLLIIVYHLLAKAEKYQDLGGTYFDELDREKKEQRLVRQLEKLGFEVSLTPAVSQT
jgi:transposase